MTTSTSDASLVAGHLAGDPAALAAIYDRYADSLHDTAAAMLNDRSEAADVLQDVILIAAERLEQLRDPDRLKPWLFAILRNEVYRRTKKRRRTIVTDFSGSDDGIDMVDPRLDDPGDAATDDITGDELAELVRNAARGLDERDQLVLELSVRQGLGGQDLADALGVSTNQSYTLVHRMRERVEKSLGAYAVARAGRRDCPDLDSVLEKWDGEFSVLIRKRVARHIESCDTCDRRRKTAVPFAMFAAAPVYAAPAELRDRVLAGARATPSTPYRFVADGGFPTVVRNAVRVAAWVAPAAAAVLLLLAGAVVVLFAGRDDVPDELATVERVEAVETTAVPTSTSTVANSTTTTPTTPAVPDSVVAPAPTRDPNATAPSSSVVEGQTKEPAPTLATTTTDEPTTTTTTTTTTNTTTAPPVVAPPVPAPDPTPPTDPAPAPPPAPDPTTTTTAPPAPGSLSVSGGSIALGSGSGSSSGSVTLSNTGDLPVEFTVTGSPGSFVVSPLSGSLAGGTSIDLVASIERSGLPEGGVPGATMEVSGAGTSASVELSATVERPPLISAASGSVNCFPTVDPNANGITIAAQGVITDETTVSATMTVSGPTGQSGSDSMGPDGATWFGAVNLTYSPNDPGSVSGTWSWTITATDARGNSASVSGTAAPPPGDC